MSGATNSCKKSEGSSQRYSWRGLETLETGIGEILEQMRPPTKLTVSQWADQKRMLSPESAAAPGKWNTDRAPYERGVMDAVNDPAVETIVWMKSAQVGASEVGLNIIGYYIDQDPCPILMITPTLQAAQDWSKDRLYPVCRDTPCLTQKVSEEKSRDSDR